MTLTLSYMGIRQQSVENPSMWLMSGKIKAIVRSQQ